MVCLYQPLDAVFAAGEFTNAEVKSPFFRAPEALAVGAVACNAVGVPLITPADESVKPAGRAEPLASAHVNGPVPVFVVTCKVVEYADPLVAPGTVEVAIVGAAFTFTVTSEEVVSAVVVTVEVEVNIFIDG